MSDQEEFVKSLPPFTDDVVNRLRHTVAAFADQMVDTGGENWALIATMGWERHTGSMITGLTFNDLRALLEIISPS